MKKYLIFILPIVVIALAVGFFVYEKPDKVLAGIEDTPVILTVTDYGKIVSGNNAGGATTTITYSNTENYATTTKTFGLDGNDQASTTIEALINGAQAFDFNFCVNASTTPPTLVWQNYFSNDVATSSRTWFQETSSTAASAASVTHGLVTHSISLATTTEDGVANAKYAVNNYRCINVLTTPVGAKSVLIKIGVQGTTGATLWPQVVPKFEL